MNWFFSKGDDLRYRCVVVDKAKVDIARFHDGDQELGFYKFYFQLLKHWMKAGNSYNVFLDYKTNRQGNRLEDLKRCLGHTCLDSSVLTVQAIRSRESVLIQATDFFTGAVSACLNESIVGSKSKQLIIQEIENNIGGGIRATGPWEKKFNIFAIQPHGGL